MVKAQHWKGHRRPHLLSLLVGNEKPAEAGTIGLAGGHLAAQGREASGVPSCGVAMPGTGMTRHRADPVFIKANKTPVNACDAEQPVFGSTHEGSQ